MDFEIDVDKKDTSKSVPHSDASLNDINLAAFELEENTEDNLEHLFPQSPEYKTVYPRPLHTYIQALTPTSSY